MSPSTPTTNTPTNRSVVESVQPQAGRNVMNSKQTPTEESQGTKAQKEEVLRLRGGCPGVSRLLDVFFSFWVRFGSSWVSLDWKWQGGARLEAKGRSWRCEREREREEGEGRGTSSAQEERGRSSTRRRLASRSERLRSTSSLETGFTHHLRFEGEKH
ncbi:hypothetical protein BDY24DRAFT_82236 [Mrakia frigida]|uniref:uncharacterized protein n=1 Tax=Mrakia frigida TaxID=29902 RepID=UPI003FCC1EF3